MTTGTDDENRNINRLRGGSDVVECIYGHAVGAGFIIAVP